MSDRQFWWEESIKKRNGSSKLEDSVVVITSSLPEDNKSAEITLRKFTALLGTSFKDIQVVISGKSPQIADDPEWIHWLATNFNERGGKNLFGKLYRHIVSQIKTIGTLRKLNLKKTPVFFWNAGDLVLPNVYVRMKKANNFFFMIGDCSIGAGEKYPGFKGKIISIALKILQNLNLIISKHICVENLVMLETFKHHLLKYRAKVIEISLFINTNQFKFEIPYQKRQYDLCYVGRFSTEKGILQLLRAFEKINSFYDKKFTLILAGDGTHFEMISKKSREIKEIILHGWVKQEELSALFNKSKLLVLPSYTEGLPNVVIEAMACGTPVLATPVGGIPGVVITGETGWLLENNSPEAIVKGIECALNSPDSSNISERARKFILNNYSFNASVHRLKRNLKMMSM